MKRVLILYFSGVGATEQVAKQIAAGLSAHCQTDVVSVERGCRAGIAGYDALVIGTPVYHGAPAKRVMDCLKSMPRLEKETPAFVFNTRGLCSLNTNRILAKALREKNIATILDRAYRSPASDGVLLAPFIKRFYEFEKDLAQKLERDCARFLKLLGRGRPRGYIPKFSWGSLVNAPNKAAGQLLTVKIHLHKGRCARCGQCVRQCPHRALSAGKSGYPLFDSKRCENCYRCVHHCPQAALSLRKRRIHQKRLQY